MPRRNVDPAAAASLSSVSAFRCGGDEDAGLGRPLGPGLPDGLRGLVGDSRGRVGSRRGREKEQGRER